MDASRNDQSGFMPLFLIILIFVSFVIGVIVVSRTSFQQRNATLPMATSSAPRHSVITPPTILIVTEADNGKTFTLAKMSHVTLRLPDTLWSQPTLEGKATINQVNYFKDTGFQEWEITPLAEGSIVLRSMSASNCGAISSCPPKNYLVTIKISG